MTDKSVFAFVTLLSVFPCFSVICDFLRPCFDASPAENMVQHLPDPQNVFLHAYQCISPHKQMDILSEPTCSLNFLHYLTFSCFVLFFPVQYMWANVQATANKAPCWYIHLPIPPTSCRQKSVVGLLSRDHCLIKNIACQAVQSHPKGCNRPNGPPEDTMSVSHFLCLIYA